MTTRLCRAVAPCLLAGVLGACHDLALPDVSADGGVGPDITVVSPREGQTIPLNAPVNIQAVSVNGVASVTVTCGGAPSTGVFTWNVEPYTGVVDFTRCSLVTSGSDAGFGQLQLTFIAMDRQGHASTKSFNVFLDTTTAALSAVLPERVVPLASLQLTVGSDRPLLLPPTVRLAGREADGIVRRTNPDGGAPLYDVTFLRAPGLGIDNYGGDPFNVPFEVLTDVERGASITVDAKATNGNSSHLEQGVLLSRVRWIRSVPGRIAVAAASPVATSAGVQVALATRDLVPGPTAEWLPGFFRSSDGTYVAFDAESVRVVGPSLPPGPVAADAGSAFPANAGYMAVDFDAFGRVLMARPSTVQQGGSDVVALDQPSGQIRGAASYTVPFPLVARLSDGGVLGQTLTRMDDLLCLPDTFSGSQDGCWYAAPTATQTLTCMLLDDGGQDTAVGTSSTLALGPPTPGQTSGAHGSPRTYLAPNDVSTGCGPVWAFLALPGDLFVAQDRVVDAAFGTGCYAGSFGSVVRLLPFPDGSFATLFDVDCPTGTGWEAVKVNANGAVTGSFLAPQGVFLPDPLVATPPLVLAALADGNVVTMRNEPPNTVFEAWPPDGTGPAATARVPGLYVYGGASVPRLPRDVMAGSDGSLTVLLNGATFGDVVLHFGPGLKPRFLYRYPLLASASTLVAADGESVVYYVDPLNNVLVALDRRGGSSSGPGCVVNGVSVTANPSSIASGATASLTATVSSSGPCSGAVAWSVAPSGGTLSPDGNTAVFSSSTPGTYTITATSVADPSRSGTATVTVTGAAGCGPATTTVTHSTNISADESWAGNGVTHLVPATIAITGTATVTVQPCATVSLGAGASINVNNSARLVSAGTGSFGNVSFVPTSPTAPWGALRGNSATSLIDLTWTTLQGAGALGGQGNNSAITVAGPGYGVAPVPVLRVNNVTIDTPQGGGIYLDTSSAFTSDSTGLTIKGAIDYVLSSTIMAVGSIPPGSYNDPSNDHGFVDIIGPNVIVFADLTIHNYLPVRIKSAGMNVRAPSGTTPVTLTVEAGAQIRFARVVAAPGALVEFGTAGNAPNNQVGVLIAQGTASEPILFTSDESAPVPGDWFGLWLATSPGSQLDHVIIEYAGSTSGALSSTNCRPTGTVDAAALFVGSLDTEYVPPSNLLTNSTIRFSQGFGIDAIWQASSFNAPNLTSGNTFQGNGFCAQTYNELIPPAICGTNHGCTAP